MELSKNVISNNKKQVSLSAVSKYIDNLTLPSFKELDNKDYINYGTKNDFPNQLIDLYNNSGIHHRIIDSKVNMIVGGGIKSFDNLSSNTQQFIRHPNSNESLLTLLSKITFDYLLYGVSYVNITWSRNRRTISRIDHVDASKIRWGKLNELNKLTHFYYSRYWTTYKRSKPNPIKIPIYDPTKNNEEVTQILPIVRFSPGTDYYSFPDYIGGIQWIKIDTEISNYQLNNLLNGFAPTIFVSVPMEATDEEMDEFIRDFENKYQGTSGDLALFSFTSPGVDNRVEVNMMDMTNADKQYDALNKTTLQQILISHGITNENLVGISTPGKLGSASDILTNHELFYNTIIKNDQAIIMAKINEIFLQNGLDEIEIIRNKPVEFQLGDDILKEIASLDEKREMVGLKPLEENVVDESKDKDEDDEYEMYDSKKHKLSKEFNFLSDTELVNYENDKDFFLWQLGDGDDHCPSCKGFSGQVRTLKSWRRKAMPRIPSSTKGTDFPHSPYSTFCEDACTCKLVKVN